MWKSQDEVRNGQEEEPAEDDVHMQVVEKLRRAEKMVTWMVEAADDMQMEIRGRV